MTNDTAAAMQELYRAVAKRAGPETSGILQAVEGAIREIRGELEVLRETALHDAGTWREGTTYRRNAVATHRGTIWCAREETQDRPGTSSAWRWMAGAQDPEPLSNR